MKGASAVEFCGSGVLGMLYSESGQVGIATAAGDFPLSELGLFRAPECEAIEAERDTVTFKEEAA